MVNRHEQMRAECQVFHDAHPEVWDAFKRFTFDRISRGCRHWSVNGVFERIRWETPLGDDGVSEFKINNNHRPFYARRFMAAFPQHLGFFQLRKQTSEEQAEASRAPLVPSDFPDLPQEPML